MMYHLTTQILIVKNQGNVLLIFFTILYPQFNCNYVILLIFIQSENHYTLYQKKEKYFFLSTIYCYNALL